MKKKNLVRVKDVMITEYDIVNGIATVAEALKNASHLENGCVIVNRRNDNDEYGILLLSDITRKIVAFDRAPDRVNVYEIMTKPVIPVNPNMDIRYCARLFNGFRLAFAPVIKDREILGIISYKEIILRGLMPYLN